MSGGGERSRPCDASAIPEPRWRVLPGPTLACGYSHIPGCVIGLRAKTSGGPLRRHRNFLGETYGNEPPHWGLRRTERGARGLVCGTR
jgi:hypothetical protein